jgi:CRISPR/Cas system-associated exonuclease Cas4 (RecB family)
MKDRIQAFCELAQERGHKIEVLEADSEETVRSALGEKLQELGALMDQGVIRPHGDAQKHCTRCQFRSLCGKPYLEGDIDDVAN